MSRKGCGPLGGHEQEILERIEKGERPVDLAREFGVSRSAISQMKYLHDLGLTYTFHLGVGVNCKVVFQHIKPVTRAHILALIQQLEREAELLGEYEDEEKEKEEGTVGVPGKVDAGAAGPGEEEARHTTLHR